MKFPFNSEKGVVDDISDTTPLDMVKGDLRQDRIRGEITQKPRCEIDLKRSPGDHKT
jgi:hypothetical protein